MDELIPISRIEKYLTAIGDKSDDVPQPITRNEKYLYAIATGSSAVPPPVTRNEIYLSAIAMGGKDVPEPITRTEKYLYAIATGDDKYGVPEPITRNERLLAKISGVDVGGGGGETGGDDIDNDDTIPAEWKPVFKAIADGTYKDKYAIGDTIPLDLGSEGLVNMQIVAFDADELADGSGYAPITWVSERLLLTSHRMNLANSGNAEGTGTIGGWEKTEMRAYLKETVLPLIPEEVRNRIVEVKKYSSIYNTAGSAVNNVETTDDVWIPSCREIFGGTSYETQGVIYSGVFTSADTRKKMKVAATSAAAWWLRSANSTTNFRYVGSGGTVGISGGAGVSFGVALGFCT